MIFGRLPLDQASGALLAHGLTVAGRRLKKGHCLSSADIDGLRADGITDVLAARPEVGDVPEDQAAERAARAAAGASVRVNAPFTGRCNIYAAEPGVALVDRAAIDAMNRIDESLTIATVAPFAAVDAGQMLATIKVIPFAAPEAVVAAAERAVAGAVALAPFRACRAGVISTRLPETKDSVIAKGVDLMRQRLARAGSTLGADTEIAHHEDAVAGAIREQVDLGLSPVVIFAASAITDRRDVIPEGIVRAGGTVRHYGMPVDPGNLLLVGEVDGVPVIGAPGCARSPKENGFDWVLHRLLAGLEVGPEAVAGMGVGGLLMDTGQRGAPRVEKSAAPRMPRVAVLVLAAGQSRRMGPDNKLLLPVGGKPMVRHAVDAALGSAAVATVVVTGHEAGAIHAALEGVPVTFAHNPLFADGLSTSMIAGLDAVPAGCDAAIVCLGDMPQISAALLDRLISAWNPVEGRAIVVPVRAGKRGNPVLFDRSLFGAMREVAGDTGARHLIGLHEDLVAEIAVDDDTIFTDVDTPEAFRRLAAP